MPVRKRVPVHGPAPPSTRACDCGNEIRADASFDLHALRNPSVFLDDFDTFVFLDVFAFGLRASLLDRICPLAIIFTFLRFCRGTSR
jgi:hypothetical protein